MGANGDELEIDITKNPEEQMITMPSEDDTSDEQDSDETSQGDTTAPNKPKPTNKSNKSNFKKLSESKKASDAKIKQLEAQLAEMQGEDNEDDEDDSDNTPNYDKVDLLEFLINTPGAAKFKQGITEALEEYPGIPFEKALKLAQIDGPEESSSYNNFKARGSSETNTKKLKDLTREEAINLPIEQFEVWQKSQSKKTDNPFG